MTIVFDDVTQNRRVDDFKKEEEEELMKLLSDKYGLPYIDLRGMAPEPDAMRMIKEETAKEISSAPFKIVGRKLYIATTNPNNPKLIEIINSLESRGNKITLFICSHSSLNHVIARYADINEITKLEGGMIDFSKEKLDSLMSSFETVKDLTKSFETLSASDVLYKTTKLIELTVAGAIKLGASDIHIEPEEDKLRIRYRLNGSLEDISFLPNSLARQIINRFKLLSGLKLSNTSNAQDGRFSISLGEIEIEVRVSVIPGNYGESFVMRLLDPRNIVSDLDKIDFGVKIRDLVEKALARPNGIILTTGPTGSGKTTTLYAFLNKTYKPEIKIVTIEDPVEYHLEGITQTQVEEEKGYTFLSGLRSVLRQDPDIIMVGEIRDEDTAKIAVNAALTGHIVFSTLHTNNAAGTIPRLIDLKVNPKVIPSALSLALAQRLIRKLCPECKAEYIASEKETRLITNILGEMKIDKKDDSMEGFTPSESYKLYKAVGCAKCSKGYKGRTGLFEAVPMTRELEDIIIKNPSEHEIKEIVRKQGIPTMLESGIIKTLAGITSLEEVGSVVDLYEEK